jgi:uncharacterized repeat protein (TIGR04138 family)
VSEQLRTVGETHMSMQDPRIADIVRRDPRYMYEAYEFVLDALNHTQRALGRSLTESPEIDPGPEHHVNGPELLAGCCAFGRQEFGLLAKTVFHAWGVRRTDDIGEIVFNLIESHLLSKTDSDSKADFENVFELDRALTDGFTILLESSPSPRQGSRR